MHIFIIQALGEFVCKDLYNVNVKLELKLSWVCIRSKTIWVSRDELVPIAIMYHSNLSGAKWDPCNKVAQF